MEPSSLLAMCTLLSMVFGGVVGWKTGPSRHEHEDLRDRIRTAEERLGLLDETKMNDRDFYLLAERVAALEAKKGEPE